MIRPHKPACALLAATLLLVAPQAAPACTATDVPGLQACVTRLTRDLAEARDAVRAAWLDGAATACDGAVAIDSGLQRSVARRQSGQKQGNAACALELVPLFVPGMGLLTPERGGPIPGGQGYTVPGTEWELVHPGSQGYGVPGAVLDLGRGNRIFVPLDGAVLATRPPAPGLVVPAPY